MTYITYKSFVVEYEMGELIKIETREVLSFFTSNRNDLQIVEKTDVVKSYDTTKLYEEDETSIYEYDYDCLKKRGYLDGKCSEAKK